MWRANVRCPPPAFPQCQSEAASRFALGTGENKPRQQTERTNIRRTNPGCTEKRRPKTSGCQPPMLPCRAKRECNQELSFVLACTSNILLYPAKIKTAIPLSKGWEFQK